MAEIVKEGMILLLALANKLHGTCDNRTMRINVHPLRLALREEAPEGWMILAAVMLPM